MKNCFGILISVIMLSTILFTSCKKELPLEEAIIGKWEVTSYKYVVYQNNEIQYETTVYIESDELAIQFAEGGAGLIYEYGILTGNFEWSLSNNTLSIDFGLEYLLEWDINIDEDIIVWSYTETDTEDETITYEFFYNAQRSS